MGADLYFVAGSQAAELGVGRRAWLPDVVETGYAVAGVLLALDPPRQPRTPVVAIDSNGDEVRAFTCESSAVHTSSALPLFAYGTLMTGESRHEWIEPHGIERIERAWVRGLLMDLGEHPGMVRPLNVRGHVHGELITLRDLPAAIRETDPVEDFKGFGVPGSWFRRTILNAHLEVGRTQGAWVYISARPLHGRDLIPEGDWKSWKSAPRRRKS